MEFVKAKTEGCGLPTFYEDADSWNSDIQVLWSRGQTARKRQFPINPTQVPCPPGVAELADVYHVSHEIGRGSFGIVWSGCHKQLQSNCVVKCVRKDNVGKDYVFIHATCDMFTRLLQISQDTPHKNVIQYLDFLMGPSMIYVVMEELTGPELFKYMQDQAPMRLDVCQRLMKQLMSAVAHIHSVGIIHRDVKVEALRFRDSRPDSDLVLFDFGHCCFDGDVQINIIGTATYMAPEQFTRNYNSKVDTWACGVILYIMITGQLPFRCTHLSGARPASKEELELALNNDALKGIIPLACDLLALLLSLDSRQRSTALQALEHVWLATDGHAYPAFGLDIGKHMYLEAEKCAAKSEVFSFMQQDSSPPFRRSRILSTEELQEAFLDGQVCDSKDVSSEGPQSSSSPTQRIGVDNYMAFNDSVSTELLRESFEESVCCPTFPSVSSGLPKDWNANLGQLQGERSLGIPQRFTFSVPGSKLVSRESSVVLPLFQVNSRGELFPFRIQVVAKKIHHKRFGQSFKTARGQGFLELKCESSKPPTLDLWFQFGIGSHDKVERASAQMSHNFLSNSIGRLSSGHDLWDFTAAVDPGTKCFSVFLDIS